MKVPFKRPVLGCIVPLFKVHGFISYTAVSRVKTLGIFMLSKKEDYRRDE